MREVLFKISRSDTHRLVPIYPVSLRHEPFLCMCEGEFPNPPLVADEHSLVLGRLRVLQASHVLSIDDSGTSMPAKREKGRLQTQTSLRFAFS